MTMTENHREGLDGTQVTPLRTIRVASGQTQGDVCRALAMDQGQYSRIERGVSTPSPELADRMAKHFGNAVTRDQILFPYDYMAPEAKAS